ncbi:MAG: hypothetical protein WBE79_05975 [Candidatus Cybelea sp.]
MNLASSEVHVFPPQRDKLAFTHSGIQSESYLTRSRSGWSGEICFMKCSWFCRDALSLSATLVLSSCGGSSMPTAGVGSWAADLRSPHGGKTFYYTGREQTFLVPKGVRRISVVARGAAGGGYYSQGVYYLGLGGRVKAIIPVQPAETLYVFVGSQGSSYSGGFNGGGNGGYGSADVGTGGGGASDVREGGHKLKDRILVVGGGGGLAGNSGNLNYGFGGKGGGSIGGTGGSGGYQAGGGGHGGTQRRGGSGGSGGQGGYASRNGLPGKSGALGVGGSGGAGGSNPSGYGGGGAGAGGGYYGGGGGGGGGGSYGSLFYGGSGGSGGGGSSYVEPSAVRVHSWQGWKNATGDGLIVFS